MAAIPQIKTYDDIPDADDEILARVRFIEEGESGNEELKALYSGYGYIYIRRIVNNSKQVVHFENPYYGKSGDINPEKMEDDDCKGYVPYYDQDRKYEITYYNENLRARKKILIKDLGGDWTASFYQEGTSEDIRVLNPSFDSCWAGIVITIDTVGYELFETTGKCKKGKELFG